jgi:teichuronic acid exporter
MLRSVATILKGSLLAQVMGFLILPLLTRSFRPEAFGQFQVFQAILTVLLIIVSLRYEIAVLRAADGREFSAVVGLCGIMTVATTIIVSFGFVLAEWLASPAIIINLQFPWWYLSLSMLIGGSAQLLGYVATRSHDFAIVANSKVSQAIANAGSTGAMAIVAPISSGLILGDLAGRCANLAWLARGTRASVKAAVATSWTDILAVMNKFRDLWTVSLPSALLNAIGTSITPLFIYGSFNAATSGQFGLVERSVGLPIGLIVVAVSQVHMAHLATDLRSGGDAARRNFLHIAAIFSTVAIIPAVGCVIFAIPLFNLVFGTGWSQAALFAQLMAPAYFLALITGGINMTLTVVGRQKTQFIWNAARFTAMALLWLAAPAAGWSITWIIGTHSAINSLFSILLLALSYRALPRGEMQPLTMAGI